MAAPVPVSSYRWSLGIAKETTKGTAASAMADWIALKERPDFTPQVNYLMDKSNRGSLVDNTGIIAGITWSEIAMKGDVMADTIGYPLAGVLGQVATTGGSAPFKHTVTLHTNQPTAYTLLDNYAAASRLLPGAQFEEVSFSFTTDGFLEWSAKAQTYASSTTNTATPSFTTQPPLAGWIGATSVGGTTSSILLSADLTIKRQVERIYTAQNQQGPAAIFGGEVGVSGSLTFVMEGDAELTRFLTNTQPAIVLDFTQGSSSALVEVKFIMTSCAYTGPPKIDGSGIYNKITVPFTAVGNTTDVGAAGGYGPIQCVVQNAKAASTYV